MPNATTNPSRLTRRSQIVAEAVVSAYIHEIAPSTPRRDPDPQPEREHELALALARRGCAETPKLIARPGTAGRAQRRPFAPRRRAALEVGA
jgi:hypothetical protein